MANKLAHDRFRKSRLENSPPTYGVPRFLNLNRKVFLSHSGGDKDFVWFLHEQLCNRYHDAIAFFDVVTLPKAEPVSMENILDEAKGSELGVLVLSEDFFMRTPNPMRELVEFTTSEVRLLPLFFKISVAQFKERSRRARWEKQWKKWAAGDKGVINAWKRALDFVNTFAGLEYHKVATNHCDYVHEIVKAVTRIIRPAILFSEEGVYGKDRLCKIVEGMYERCTLKRTSNDGTQVASASTSSGVREDCHYALDVVGVYGFAGLGKTTLCKCLCDIYFAEFNGKVCHIDLGLRPSDQASSQTDSSKAFNLRMKYVLAMLTDYTNDGQLLQFSQVQNLLRDQFSSMMDPVFLAIDNVLPEWESQMEACFYLSLKFPKDSKIFLTSRSCGILENLASQFSSFSVEINHIPGLELQEARDTFVHEIPEVHDPDVLNLQDEVNNLVRMCRIHFHKGLIEHPWASAVYHPLMLKSLAASIKWKRTRNLDWKGRLAKLLSEGIVDKNDAWKMVFKVLDVSYEILREEAKTLFLDLVLFHSATQNADEWLAWVYSVYSHLHNKKIEEILLQLQDLFFIRIRSQPPNLLVDFAKYKALQEVGCGSRGNFYMRMCPTLGKIDGLLQYAGNVDCYIRGAANLEETFGDLLKSAGVDSSICKAKVDFLRLSGLSPGLAGAEWICVEDAQHIGLLIAALFKAQPACHLVGLRISCKKGGDCGCDKMAPNFGPAQLRNALTEQAILKYCCPQVRDLSSVAQWDVLADLNLSGCTSVEVWPNFATMTSLRRLDLSYSCLKVWPVGVQLLQHLLWLDLRGCTQLAAEELIKVIALEHDIELSTCGKFALGTLMADLESGVRDRWSVMNALDSQFHELCQCGGFESWHCNIQFLAFIIALLYDLWYDEGCGAASDCCEGSPSATVVGKMRRLLCSAVFMQLLPVHLLSRVKEGLKDPYMAFALMGIAVVGAASIGWHNAAVNESVKDSIIGFFKSCSQGEGSSSTMLQQDHLYFQIHWPIREELALFRQLSLCPDILGTRVPKLWERVVEGVRKMASAAQLGPDSIQGFEALLLSRNFLQYDVKWLLSSYIKYSEQYYLEEDILRVYYNLLGKSVFQSFCEWEPGLPKNGLYNITG